MTSVVTTLTRIPDTLMTGSTGEQNLMFFFFLEIYIDQFGQRID